MPLLFDKVLSVLAYPLGALLIVIGAALMLVAATRQKRAGLLSAGLALLALWAASTPPVAGFAQRSLELQYPAQKAEEAPMADVIIVIGGGVALPTAYNPYPDLAAGGDRVLHALRLFKAGKAPKILLSGGWAFDSDAPYAEADAMADLLVAFGVGRDRLIIERRSRTTFENAEFTKQLWKENNFTTGLLVTSAFHMPRALAVFRKAGLNVQPAVTDVTVSDAYLPFPLPILPDAASLAITTSAIKEWLGLFIYRWRGWA